MEDSFSSYIRGEQILLKYAKGVGALRGKEFHEYHELILFIDGDVDFYSDEMHVKLVPDQLIIIPKEKYHQFVINGNENNYVRCVFSFYETPEIRELLDGAFYNVRVIEASEYALILVNKIIELSQSELSSQQKNVLLRAMLIVLISEISCEMPHRESLEKTARSPLLMKCIDYINHNLFGDISIKKLAKQLNVSQSTISHTFKKEMNISPYRYILQKRLINAQTRIANGESATAVAFECGFSDYSGFYKQYKKAFGVVPSGNKISF